jgi:membrane-bound lytic murein transglycosylase
VEYVDNMNKLLVAIVLSATLALTYCCASAQQVRAKNAMLASMAAYERCLQQNPADPSKCEALKRVYEADYQAYQAAKQAGGPILTGFMEVGGR